MIFHRFMLVTLLGLLFLASKANAEDGTGYLGIKSQPDRALVYLDGKYVNASTPTAQLLGLRAGRYRLELAKQGYKLYQEMIVIEAGKILELDVIMVGEDSEEISKTASQRYMEAYLTVTSDPRGADVYLDDKSVGKTPIRDLGIQASEEQEQKDRELRIVKSGYKSHVETLSWVAIRDRIKIYISAELKPEEEEEEEKANKPSPGPKSRKPRKFTMNSQVIMFSIMLGALILIFVVRMIIIRHRNTGAD